MSYQIYTSRALVLSTIPTREDGLVVLLLSKEFGLIYAQVRAGRALRSKLRPSLCLYMDSEVSLVRGKGMWRVTGAREVTNFYARLKNDPHATAILARFGSLLKRLLVGEEPHEAVYTIVVTALEAIASYERERSAVLSEIESLTVLRILYTLGYVAPEGAFLNFVRETAITKKEIDQMRPLYRKAVQTINQSLAESQL